MMNKNKICFIVFNDERIKYSDNLEYIKMLNVPEGMSVECLGVEQCDSMFEAYNEGMESSDAKYKVYLTSNTYIINKDIIYDILKIFENEKDIIMLGMAGRKGISTKETEAVEYGEKMWDSIELGLCRKKYHEVEGTMVEVDYLDKMLIVTQQDLVWGKDICDTPDGYITLQDNIKSKDEYKIGVVKQIKPWCFSEVIC